MKSVKPHHKFFHYLYLIRSIKLFNRKMNFIMFIFFIFYLIASTNIFNSYLSHYYDFWTEELNAPNYPETQIKISGKLNESFIYDKIYDTINKTISKSIVINSCYSITSFNRNYFNISWSLEDISNSTLDYFELYVFNEQLLAELSLEVNDSSVIVSEKLFTSIGNRTSFWFLAKNETTFFSNHSIAGVLDRKISFNNYFIETDLSLLPNNNFVLMSYSGFCELLKIIKPYEWINNQKADCFYLTSYSLELELNQYKNERPKIALKQYNEIITSFISTIIAVLNNLDSENLYFPQDDFYISFELIDSFQDRVLKLQRNIQPYRFFTLFLFIFLQAIFLSLVYTLIKTYIENSYGLLKLSFERGLKNKQIKSAYFYSVLSKFVISFTFFFTFQFLYYFFEDFSSWKELYFLISVIFVVVLVFFVIVCYLTFDVIEKLTLRIFYSKRLKKYSRSERFLLYFRYLSLLMIPLAIALFLILNLKVLAFTNISTFYIIGVSLGCCIFSYILLVLPKNYLRLCYFSSFFIIRKISNFFLYLIKALNYTLKKRQHFSILLFYLLFILNSTLIFYDSSTFYKQKQVESSYGLDATIITDFQNLQLLNITLNSSKSFVIYELPGNDLITKFYLVDTPALFYSSSRFFNEYFTEINNEQIFSELERNGNLVITSTYIQKSLNLKKGDIYYPFIVENQQNLNFTILDFASFLPIISSVSSIDSWMVCNNNVVSLQSLIHNRTKIFFSFELPNNFSINEIRENLKSQGIFFTLIHEDSNPYLTNYSTFENFQKKQVGFLTVLNIIFAILISINLMYYITYKTQINLSFFVLHGYKPSKAYWKNFLLNTLAVFMMVLINLMLSVIFYYLFILVFTGQEGLTHTFFLKNYSIVLMILPFIFFTLTYITVGKKIFRENMLVVRRKEIEN